MIAETPGGADDNVVVVGAHLDSVGVGAGIQDNGSGSATKPPSGAPEGSAQIEKLFPDYFASQGLETEPTPFDGRSDYGPFIEAGIPAGGPFTGAEGIETEGQEGIYGGIGG